MKIRSRQHVLGGGVRRPAERAAKNGAARAVSHWRKHGRGGNHHAFVVVIGIPRGRRGRAHVAKVTGRRGQAMTRGRGKEVRWRVQTNGLV
jgi:hypothetical protein